MTDQLTGVLDLPVAVTGGEPLPARRGSTSYGPGMVQAGGYSLAFASAVWRGVRELHYLVELREHGPDTLVTGCRFEVRAEAEAEFARLKALLALREWVGWAAAALGGVLPAEYLPALGAADVTCLMVAADQLDEQGNDAGALVLRAAYHAFTGTANEPVKADRKTTIWTFRVGDQAEYGSYSLVYYAPIEKITAKMITVAESTAASGATTRFDPAGFAQRNWDFDLAAARKRNSEWMD